MVRTPFPSGDPIDNHLQNETGVFWVQPIASHYAIATLRANVVCAGRYVREARSLRRDWGDLVIPHFAAFSAQEPIPERAVLLGGTDKNETGEIQCFDTPNSPS